MPKKLSRMQYLGGYSPRAGLVAVLAFPVDFPSETEFTLVYTNVDGKWMQLPFEFDIASLTYLKRPAENYKGWWMIGKRGEVVEVVGGKPRTNRIETAGTGPRKHGYLTQIRVIGNELFICGYRRQVYRRQGNNWDLISGNILDSRAKPPWRGFESIDGFAPDDVYAVGSKGEIWYFDGKTWHQCDSPTDQNLADVRCLADHTAWACGDGGIILRGDRNRWEVVHQGDEPSENWWSLESFQNRIYVAGNDFLGVLADGEVLPVDVKIKKKITTQTLHQMDGTLWSIGEEDILGYDGTAWRELVVPENQ